MPAKPIKIYGLPVSVHTRKVIIAARIKSIPHEIVPVVPIVPEACPPNWRAISPTGLIPALEDDGFHLADSTAILHYLERKQPEPALVPSDLRDFGTALFFDAWAGTLWRDVVRPILHPIFAREPVAKATLDAALNKALPVAFGFLEGLAPDAFLVGKKLSIADIAVVSNLINFYFTGNRIDTKRFPKLEAYFRRHLESPLLASILAVERPFAEQVPGLDTSILQ
jgi:glutathione S-transferase